MRGTIHVLVALVLLSAVGGCGSAGQAGTPLPLSMPQPTSTPALLQLQALTQGDIYELVAAFMPAPVVDKASSLGISHWVTRKDDQDFVIYFCRQQK